jgi:hypothetical protein
MVSIISFHKDEIDPYGSILNDVRLCFPKILIFQVRTENSPELVESYEIRVKPTMVFLSFQKEHKRLEGETNRDDVFAILRELTENNEPEPHEEGEWY